MGLADALAPNIANGLRPWRYGAPASANVLRSGYVQPTGVTRLSISANGTPLSLTGAGIITYLAYVFPNPGAQTVTLTINLDGAQWTQLVFNSNPSANQWYLFVGQEGLVTASAPSPVRLPLRVLSSFSAVITSWGGVNQALDYEWMPDF